MKRLLAAVVAALAIAGAVPAAGQPAYQPPAVYVVNESTNVTDAEVADALPAFQNAVDQDFAPEWNAPALVRQASGPLPARAWVIRLQDHSDVGGAGGYHTTCPLDTPCAKVFTDEGLSWQLIFTHELFELLLDPHVDRVASINIISHTMYALEVADAVEQLSYTRPGASGKPVTISDFVTERWFDGQNARGVKYDFLGKAKHAHHVLPGGYITIFRNGSWSSNVVRLAGHRAAIMPSR